MPLGHGQVRPSQDTYRYQSGNSDGFDLTDGLVFYIALSFATPILGDPTTSAPTAESLTVPKEYIGGTIRRVFLSTVVFGTQSSGENCTVAVLVNNTTATDVITNLETNAVSSSSDSGEVNVALPPGCFWVLRITAPTFATEPQDVHFVATAIVTRP